MSIFSKILNHNSFKDKPPVLMHIGAAGPNFEFWKAFSKFSTIISIDGVSKNNKKKNYKKDIKINNIISNKKQLTNFYITSDPHCSSLLLPKKDELKNWYFEHRFRVKKKLRVKTITINQLLKDLNIDYIDWLVLDVQGMDLKILQSLDQKIKKKILFIDIEPGLRTFYNKEAKFHDVLKYMYNDFEIEDIIFGSNFKVSNKGMSKLDRGSLFLNEKKRKIYANITFLKKKIGNDIRSKLINIMFLIAKNRIYEVNEINDLIKSKDEIFKKINKYLKIRLFIYKILYLLFLPLLIFKKIFR